MLRYKEIKLLLVKDIANLGILEKLPSRNVLCKKYDTTRTTLDKAIKELEAEGVVFCRKGSGSYVAPPEGYDSTRSGNWGLIVPDADEDIYVELAQGVETVAESVNANVILCNFEHSSEKQAQYIRRLVLTGIDGLIIVPVVRNVNVEVNSLYSVLADAKRPTVFCNLALAGLNAPIVMASSFFGGYAATKHLIEKGYRHIAFLCNYIYRTSEERCQGYLAALQESGIEVDRDLILIDSAEGEPTDGYSAMKRLLDKECKVDAVFCFNDVLLPGVYKAIHECGLSVSDDIGVIGYDNTSVSTALSPRASTVSYPSREIGRLAAELLVKQVKGLPVSTFPSYMFMPSVEARESSLGPKKNIQE